MINTLPYSGLFIYTNSKNTLKFRNLFTCFIRNKEISRDYVYEINRYPPIFRFLKNVGRLIIKMNAPVERNYLTDKFHCVLHFQPVSSNQIFLFLEKEKTGGKDEHENHVSKSHLGPYNT